KFWKERSRERVLSAGTRPAQPSPARAASAPPLCPIDFRPCAVRGPGGDLVLRHVHRRDGQAILTIYDSRAGRTVWRRLVPELSGAWWSADGRAVAILVEPIRGEYFHLIVWRYGRRLQIL